MDPIADLSKLQRSNAHGHVVIPVLPVDLQPLMAGENPNNLPIPALQIIVPHSSIDPGAAGPGPGITVLVDQVAGLFLHRTESVHQFPGPVAVKPREVDAIPCQVI